MTQILEIIEKKYPVQFIVGADSRQLCGHKFFDFHEYHLDFKVVMKFYFSIRLKKTKRATVFLVGVL
tara:strand:+ start:112 stop:312 length:201 start_codon:yes stop_codon:yes gene_type:complete